MNKSVQIVEQKTKGASIFTIEPAAIDAFSAGLARAGASLANIAYNLAQPHSTLNDAIRRTMDECRKDWDAARAALASSATPATLRYTSDSALAECPCCGSLDVGGAHETVHCYCCGLTVKAERPLKNAIDKWNRRTNAARPVPQHTPKNADSDDDQRRKFEVLARDSYGFKRSRKGNYVNASVARDWKWFRLGMASTQAKGNGE